MKNLGWLASAGDGGVAWKWPGGRLGRFYYPGTIRELSGNYPGFGVGWLAGLAGLGCAVLDVPFDHLVKNLLI